MNHNLEQFLQKIGQGALYGAALVPAIIATSGFVFPFITPKVFVVQAMAMVVLVVWMILYLYEPKRYAPKKSWIFLTLAAWVLWLFISAIYGVDFYRSIWSDQERMFGIFTVASFFVLALGSSVFLREKKDWGGLAKALLLSGAVVMIGGVYQLIDPTVLAGDGGRIESTTGNATYLAFYAVFIFILSIFVWAKRAALNGSKEMLLRGVLAALMVLSVVNFFGAAARGVALGLAAAFIWVVVIAAAIGSSKKVRNYALGVMLLMVGFSALLVFGGNTRLVQSVSLLNRISDFSISGTVETRLRTWDSAFAATAEKPLFGWGWSNFAAAYDKHYNPDQLKHGYGETWFDNAHNTVIEVLTTSGVPGALLYLMMWVALMGSLFVLYKKGRLTTTEYAILSAYVVFHFVQSLFVFDHPLSYLALFYVLGYVAYLEAGQRTIFSQGLRLKGNTKRTVSVALVLLGIVMLNVTVVRAVRANRLESDSHEALALQRDIGLWHELTKQAVEVSGPYSSHIILNAGKALQELPLVALPRTQDLALIYEDMIGRVERNMAKHPHFITHKLLYVSLLANQVLLFEETKEASAALALRVAEDARELSPLRQQMFYTLIQSYMDADRFQKALPHIGMLRSSSLLRADVHRVIGGFYLLAGQHKEAIDSYEMAIRVHGSPLAVVGAGDNVELLEEYGLLQIEHGNPMRGVWFLDSIASCRQSDIDWVPCLWGSSDMAALFVPSRKALAAALIYYRQAGRDDRVAAYTTYTERFYQGLQLQQILEATP